MANSRLINTFRNSRVTLFYYSITLILQFLYRKAFLVTLGEELLGFNTTAMNLLNLLNLSELGIGAAISYSLYTPIVKNDRVTINEILSIQQFLYRRVVVVISGLTIILLLLFPLILGNLNFQPWYTYSTFLIFLIGSLSSYLFIPNQVLVVAHQNEYKIVRIQNGIKSLKLIAHLLAFELSPSPYISWLLIELLHIPFIIYFVRRVISQEFPWLKTGIKARLILKKHHEVVKKIKQIFAHKFAGFVLTESTPLIILYFTSLTFIARYGNYILISAGITAIISAILNPLNASIGNLIHSEKTTKIVSVFKELLLIRLIICFTAGSLFYEFGPELIKIWLGEEYILDQTLILLITIIFIIANLRGTVDSFIQGYGLFDDIQAPIIESVSNVSMALFLGNIYGIHGVLSAVIFSQLVMVMIWKPYYLFAKGIKIVKPIKYFQFIFKFIAIWIFLIYGIMDFVQINKLWMNTEIINLILKLLIKSILILSGFIILSFVFFPNELKSILKRINVRKIIHKAR